MHVVLTFTVKTLIGNGFGYLEIVPSTQLLLDVCLSQLKAKNGLKVDEAQVVQAIKLLKCSPNPFYMAEFVEERLRVKHANVLAISS